MDTPASINHALWQLLNVTRQVILIARQKELAEHNISTSISGSLYTILNLGEKATPTAISRTLFLKLNTVSENLKRLEKDGLIERKKDLPRKNLVRVALTKKGYEVYKKSAKRKSTEYIMSGLTDEEKEQLWRLLSKVRSRTLKYLRMSEKDLYPPDEPPEQ